MLQPDTAGKLKGASCATFIIVKAHREEEVEPLCNREQGACSSGSEAGFDDLGLGFVSCEDVGHLTIRVSCFDLGNGLNRQ